MFKKMLSVLLAALMIFSVSLPVYAAQQESGVASVGEDTEQARAYLSQMLSEAVDLLTSPQINTYTTESCEKLEQAVSAGYEVYYNPDATYTQINAQAEAVKNALLNMEKAEDTEDAEYYLATIIAQAETQVGEQTEYTADSWAVYTEAFENALYVQANGQYEYEFLDAAANLKSAIESLVPADSNVSDAREYLWDLMENADAILNGNDRYTEESKQILINALESANTVYYTPDATDEELLSEASQLKNVIDSMNKIEISEGVYNYLAEVISIADTQIGTEDSYTPETWAVFFEAYSNAVRVFSEGESEDELISAADALGMAMVGLVPVDTGIKEAREYLTGLIDSAHQILGSNERYTEASKSQLQAAADSANAVCSDENATVEEIIAEASKLENAIGSMVKVVISAEAEKCLQDAIARVDGVGNLDDYTEQSWNVFSQAYVEALNVLNYIGETDEEYYAAADALNSAIDNLVPVADDNTEYDEARSILYTTLNSIWVPVGGNYTVESIARLENALVAGWDVYNNPDATIEEIREHTANIENAYDELEEVHISDDAREYLWETINRIEEEINRNLEYTEESWDEYSYASFEAYSTYYYGKSDTEYLNAAQRLLDAYNNLMLVSEAENIAAREQLFGMIEEAENVDGNYTEDSLATLEAAIAEAIRVCEDANATTEELLLQTEKLQGAIDSLEEIILPSEAKIRLYELISEAEKMAESVAWEYDSLNEFINALNIAKEDYNTEKDDDGYNYIADILEGTMDVLTAEAREILGERIRAGGPVGGNYTNESYQNLLDTIEAASVVFEDADASFVEMNEQINLIIEAYNGLEDSPISDVAKQTLWNVIKKAETEVGERADYTPESWSVYNEVYSDVLGTYYYGQSDEEYYLAAQRLQSAMDSLQLVPVTPPTPDEIYVLLGDADGDGKVTVKDATFIQKCVASINTLEGYAEFAADANGDSVVNVKDATEIQKSIAGLKANENIGKEIMVSVSTENI